MEFVHKKDKKIFGKLPSCVPAPNFVKMFECLTCNSFFEVENDLISSKQSDFKLGDSCINRLLSIAHDICKSLNDRISPFRKTD